MRIWLSGLFFLCIFEAIMVLVFAYPRRYRGKAKAKVTDVFRHDTDDHGREAPTGYGDRVSYYGHYVFEVDGQKYRGYGSISAISRLTRKVNVRYDVSDPSRCCVETSPIVLIVPVIVMTLWTVPFYFFGLL